MRRLWQIRRGDGTKMVYWFTGLSGAGKTTLGKLWHEELKKHGKDPVFLDGDELRFVFGNDLGYTEQDRRKAAMRNARICEMLSKQGFTVICCTISMFDSVRKYNRENISDYREVYIKVPLEVLKKRDQKGLYSKADHDVAGVHFCVEEPKEPDIILHNGGEVTPNEQINILRGKFLTSGC